MDVAEHSLLNVLNFISVILVHKKFSAGELRFEGRLHDFCFEDVLWIILDMKIRNGITLRSRGKNLMD